VYGGSVPRVRQPRGGGLSSSRAECHTSWPEIGKVAIQTAVPGLRPTEAGFPAGQQGACHGVGCDVRDRDDFRPAGEAVDCSEAVCVAC
jgi:hypothetical protein